MPFVKLYEQLKYGNYASNTVMDGFLVSKAPVLIVHNADDNVVPTKYGYDIYYKKYKNDPRFHFICLEDKGHNYVYHDMTYINQLNTAYDKWLETLNYDYNNANHKEQFAVDKANYINNHLDQDKWSNMLDAELFERFVNFYDAS